MLDRTTGAISANRLRSFGNAPKDRAHRRPLDLKACGLLDDGQLVDLAVLDLSYDGCKVRTDTPLDPGTTLSLSVRCLGAAAQATVRWHADGIAGLQFATEEDAEQAPTQRNTNRIDLHAQLSLRRGGRKHYHSRIFDLTPEGCKVEFVERPKVGERVWAKFESLEAIEAEVRWVDNFFGGLAFVRPIYPAVFDILLQKLRD